MAIKRIIIEHDDGSTMQLIGEQAEYAVRDMKYQLDLFRFDWQPVPPTPGIAQLMEMLASAYDFSVGNDIRVCHTESGQWTIGKRTESTVLHLSLTGEWESLGHLNQRMPNQSFNLTPYSQRYRFGFRAQVNSALGVCAQAQGNSQDENSRRG